MYMARFEVSGRVLGMLLAGRKNVLYRQMLV